MAMAVLCRCDEHPPTRVRKHHYTHVTEPVGYPNGSSVCGNRKCENPGRILMTDDAVREFNKGRRVFNYATYVTQVRVKDIKPIKIGKSK